MDLKYKPSQNSVSVSEHPLQYKSFVQNRDVSFSSYLKPDQENNPELDSEINVFDAKKYFSESNESSPENQKNLAEPSELGTVPRHSSVSSVDGYGRNFRANSFRATPTASSEASWNSQTGLLSNPPGAIPVSLKSVNPNGKKRGSFSTRKWFFCRKCPCSGKKSIQVEESNSETRTEIGNESFAAKHNRKVPETATNMAQNGHHQRRSLETTHAVPLRIPDKIGTIQRRSESESENPHDVPLRAPDKIGTIQRTSDTHVPPSIIACQQRVLTSVRPFTETTGGFSFPILNQSTQAKLGIKLPASRSNISPILEDPARDSLEVFQPSTRKSIETDHTRCNFPFIPGSPISRVAATDDDVASDASSDLFEIESFSTSIATSCPMYRSRNSLDEPGTPSVAATECYAPSEVSIDWSVTTAEGFDRASVTNYSSISEYDNVANMRLFSVGGGGGGGSGGCNGGEGGKWKGSGLLSCRHEKAVNVGPQPLKFVSPEGSNPLPLMSTAGHVSSRPARTNKPPIASTHSARLSLAFAA